MHAFASLACSQEWSGTGEVSSQLHGSYGAVLENVIKCVMLGNIQSIIANIERLCFPPLRNLVGVSAKFS